MNQLIIDIPGLRFASGDLATALFAVAVGVAAVLVYRMARTRMRRAVRDNEDKEAMMHKALSMSTFSVMINDLRNDRVTNLHGVVLSDAGMTGAEFMAHIHPDDRPAVAEANRAIIEGRSESVPFSSRWNPATPEKPFWINVAGLISAEHDERGRVCNLVITSRNVSEDVRKTQDYSELASKYLKMFDATLVAMSFYSKDGRLVDLNENMKKLCGSDEQVLGYFSQTNLFNVDLMRDYDFGSGSNFHVCQHMHYPEVGIDKYIELRVKPATDADGALLYYIVSARDVTDERAMYVELAHRNKALRQTEETNNRYEREMRVLLENCNMYVWHADLAARRISFSRSLDSEEFTETLDDYVNGMYEDHREEATRNMQAVTAIDRAFNVVRHFRHTPVDRQPCWYAVSGMPQTDAEGNVCGLFGIVRNVTGLMEAQERLKEETARAENSGMLKSTFLANMTHEIRTPLNAIVGFSDLLHMVDAPDERKEFIRIIRNNCDMLLRLINDIFEASTMDVRPLEICPEEVDFAACFADACQSLAQRVQEPGVDFIVDNPYASFVTRIDMGRMQQVVTNFVTNAVKYTHQGHIRVGYKVQSRPLPEGGGEAPGLFVYCEDTGAGIPKEKQKSVFDRFVKLNDFVQGTGLGLSICKSIAERSGGSIGLESDGEGRGSTFWIWVPCPAISWQARTATPQPNNKP